MKDESYENVFFKQQGNLKDNLTNFIRNIDKYSFPFLNHLSETIQILAYCHEDEKVWSKWLWIQMRIYN